MSFLNFLSQVEMVKEADAAVNFLRAQGYSPAIIEKYQRYYNIVKNLKNDPRVSNPNHPYHSHHLVLEERVREDLEASLKKEHKKLPKQMETKPMRRGGEAPAIRAGRAKPEQVMEVLVHGGQQQPLVSRSYDPAYRPGAPHPKTVTTFSPREKAEIGTQNIHPEDKARYRQQILDRRRQQAFAPKPLSEADMLVQDYMEKNKGKAPPKGYAERILRTREVAPKAPNMDWSWGAGAEMRGELRPAGNQPYYGGRTEAGPKIHTHHPDATAGPQTRPQRTPSPIPGPKPGQAAPGTAGVGTPRPGPAGAPPAAAEGAAAKKGLFGRMGRAGRIGLGIGGLALLAGGLLSRNSQQQPQQMQPVYSPLAGAGYSGMY